MKTTVTVILILLCTGPIFCQAESVETDPILDTYQTPPYPDFVTGAPTGWLDSSISRRLGPKSDARPKPLFQFSWLPLLPYVPVEAPATVLNAITWESDWTRHPNQMERWLRAEEVGIQETGSKLPSIPFRLKMDYNEEDPLKSDVTEFGIRGDRLGVSHSEEGESKVEIKIDW